MTTTEKTRCCEQVYDRSSRWPRFYNCMNSAKVERDGRPYCAVHDPERKAIKDEKRREAFREKCAQEDKERRLQNAAASLLAALESVVECFECESGRISDAIIAKAKAAIERATK